MKLGSLFSGIGGMDLGLERAGMEVVWQVEIDEWCRKILMRIWPEAKQWDDVRTFPPEPVANWQVDVIAGGFPCQPHSLAGKRMGSKDKRDLWPEYHRVLGILRPQYAILENVPGIFHSDGGRYFGRILADLATLGYDAEWTTLRASNFDYTHQRERVFIVAHALPKRSGKRRTKQKISRWDFNLISNGMLGSRAPGPTDFDDWFEILNCWPWFAPAVESGLCGMVDGITWPLSQNRRAWLKTFGNAVVPECAEYIGKLIIDHAIE